MENKGIVQKIVNGSKDAFEMAEKYYNVICAVNNIHLTERELQLMAFTAIRGNMSYAVIREEFCNRYKTSSPTINNIISRLKKLNMLIKDGGKIKVNPVLLLNFNNEITLNITLKNEASKSVG